MDNINFDKEIWEGWTIGNFIEELEPTFTQIMADRGWHKPFTTREEIKKWCMEEQPHYKKYIPEIVDYFASKL